MGRSPPGGEDRSRGPAGSSRPRRPGFPSSPSAVALSIRSSALAVGTTGPEVSPTDASSAEEGIAQLEPIGNETDVENLDVYALNASGGVIDESTTNDSKEILTLSRGDLDAEDSIRLRVHGEKALHTEYRLSGTVFYRPW